MSNLKRPSCVSNETSQYSGLSRKRETSNVQCYFKLISTNCVDYYYTIGLALAESIGDKCKLCRLGMALEILKTFFGVIESTHFKTLFSLIIDEFYQKMLHIKYLKLKENVPKDQILDISISEANTYFSNRAFTMSSPDFFRQKSQVC